MDLARPSGLHARSWVTWLALDTARRRRQASAAARRARAEACDVVTQPPQWRASVGWTQFSQGGNVDAGLFAPGHARVVALLAAPAAAASGKLVLCTSQPNEDAQATVDAFNAAASRRRGGVDPRRHHQGHGQAARRAGRRSAAGGRAADRRHRDDGGARSRRASCSPIPEAPTDAYPAGLHDPDGHVLLDQADHHRHRLQQRGADAADVVARSDGGRGQGPGHHAEPADLRRGRHPHRRADGQSRVRLGDTSRSSRPTAWCRQGGNGAIFTAVAQGEKLYGIVIDYLPIREAAKGSPVTFVFPEEGSQRRHRAGGDPQHRRAIRRGGQGVRRLPAVQGGAGARGAPGLPRRPSRGGAAARLPAARRDRADGLRSGRLRSPTTRPTRTASSSCSANKARRAASLSGPGSWGEAGSYAVLIAVVGTAVRLADRQARDRGGGTRRRARSRRRARGA